MNDHMDALLGYTNPDPDTAPREGALANRRVAIRPNLSVCRWPADAGSKALENYHPIEDAAAVKRVRDNGARLMGMGKMSELGFGIKYETSHRLISEKTCNTVLGTDATGEARYLAAMAGAWGYKPSFGICSTLGMIGLVPSMECISVIVDAPFALAPVLEAVSGKETRDFSMLWDNLPNFPAAGQSDANHCKIGVIAEQRERLDEIDKKAFDEALDRLAQKGLEVETLSFPDHGLFRLVHHVVGSTEASSSAGKYDGVRYGHRSKNSTHWNDMYLSTRQEAFGELIKSYLFQGAFFQFENYPAFEHACRLRNHLLRQTETLFENIDLIVSPVRQSRLEATRAETVDDIYDAFELTLPANVAGLPALSVPGFVMAGGTDLGLQITAPHLGDADLIRFAETYMTAL